MSRTILSIAYPFAPVGPTAVGGAEQILTELDRAIVAGGDRSLVVASEGSMAEGILFPVPVPQGMLDEADRLTHRTLYQAAIHRALSMYPVDLIHMHGLDFFHYDLPRDVPVLVTLHMPPSWYSEEIWSSSRDNMLLQCVSQSQRASCPSSFRTLPVVANGVALPSPSHVIREHFALALGRICPEKNLHAALDAGTRAGIPVLLGGQVFPYRTHLDYFAQEIEPRLHANGAGPTHYFLGPLLPERKLDLLRRATCVLLPTLAPETSSLVAMEALAAGTPLIAYRSGALPEIIDDGRTGFLVDSVEAMAEAIRRASTIDGSLCRHIAAERFSLDRMISGYRDLYEQHIAAVWERSLCV